MNVQEQTASVEGLTATTRPLPGPPDILAHGSVVEDGIVWREEDFALAGRGVALRLDLPAGLSDTGAVNAVNEALRSIKVDDPFNLPGTGPVAIGAMPFDRSAPASLVVPRTLVGRRGGRAWITTVTSDAGSFSATSTSSAAEPEAQRGPPPDRFILEASVPHEEWMRIVAAAVASIRAGDMRKVVLARKVDVTANRDFVIPDVLERLIALYPTCAVFRVGGFLGASPEVLVSRQGLSVRSDPLAGTAARSGDEESDRKLVQALLDSGKDRWEHSLVIDVLEETLRPLCERLEVPETPTVLGLRNVSHLATHVRGSLKAPTSHEGRPPTAFELAAMLHPTPAVAGAPTATALGYLRDAEGFDRGSYAGPVGWVDSRGDGKWVVGIRCAELDKRSATLFAGNGIVEGSEPEAELAETQLKLQALLSAIVRP